ncbi:MAG TPA: VWA domain-containing protein [Vicinamibacterales bacterium]|nr:VWA domain-containing protein [Vicinamibacterales bacterium]
MKHALSALAAAAACAFSSPGLDRAGAQTRPTQQVYVSVADSKGDPVTGLAADAFRVREDGNAREVLSAGPATEPLTLALLVDDSQATTGATQFIREAVDGFITALAGTAEMSVVTFGERPTIVVDYTKDQKRLLDGAKRIFPRAGAGAYLMEAIAEVSRGLQKRNAARPVIVVLMMDNSVEFSNRHYEQVLNELEAGGAALHVVSLGQPGGSLADEIRNRDQVVAMGTERTGGRRDNVLALTGAAGKMKQVAEDLKNQYVVTYARPERLIPPEKIEVTAAKAGLTVRARTRAPKAPK